MTGPIGFLGLTHLGVVMSACWAHLGHEVIAVGEPVAVMEPGMATLGGDRLTVTQEPADLSACHIVFVTLDTSDPDAVKSLLSKTMPRLNEETVIVVMSQIPPGTTREFASTWSRHAFYYLAETLITGQAVERCLHPTRLILGCYDPDLVDRQLFYVLKRFVCPILRMDYESAEFAKLAINLYLASAIAYANRMAAAAQLVGADWSHIVPALRLDPRIGSEAYLRPGDVGPNIGRDVTTLEQLEAGHGL